MADFDLNTARAARAKKRQEVEGTPHTFTLGEETFSLPLDPPWGFVEAIYASGNRFELAFSAVRALLGDQYDRFLQQTPEIEDAGELIDRAVDLYGFRDTGESQASGGSSSRTSSRSRRTSNGSTRSTSRKKSGEAAG